MLKNLEVRKLIAILLLSAFIVIVGFLVGFIAITGKKFEEPAILIAFTNMVSLIVGTYYGKSTLAEGSKMNKDP